MKGWARTSSFILLSPRIGQVISFVAAAGRVAWSKQSPSSGLWECGNRRLGDSQARGETMGNRRAVFLVFHGASFPQAYSAAVEVDAAVFVRQLRGPHFNT